MLFEIPFKDLMGWPYKNVFVFIIKNLCGDVLDSSIFLLVYIFLVNLFRCSFYFFNISINLDNCSREG